MNVERTVPGRLLIQIQHRAPPCRTVHQLATRPPAANPNNHRRRLRPPPPTPPTHINFTSPAAPQEEATPRRRQGRKTGSPTRTAGDIASTATRREQPHPRSADRGAQKDLLDRPIRRSPTPEPPHRSHAWLRRDGEEGPAPLFHAAAATTTLAAPTGSQTLLSTSLRHRSEVPPLSHRRTDGRRGRRPTIWPSAEQGI